MAIKGKRSGISGFWDGLNTLASDVANKATSAVTDPSFTPPAAKTLQPTDSQQGSTPVDTVGGGAPVGNSDTTIIPPTPMGKYTNPQQSSEWELIKKQNAQRMGLAESAADRDQAMALQSVRENAYNSGLGSGTRAYGAMEQRAIDESGQQRADLLNTASQQSMAAELGQTQKDVAEKKSLDNERYSSEMNRLSAIANDDTLSDSVRMSAAQQIDALNAEHLGSSSAGAGVGSYASTLKTLQDSTAKEGSKETRATTSLVETALANRGMTLPEEQKSEIIKNAQYMGYTTPAEIINGIQSGVLLDSEIAQLSQNPQLVKNHPEKVSKDQWSKLSNTGVIGDLVDHPDPGNEAPGTKYVTGDTLIQGGIPYMAVSQIRGNNNALVMDLTTGSVYEFRDGVVGSKPIPPGGWTYSEGVRIPRWVGIKPIHPVERTYREGVLPQYQDMK